MSNYLQECGFVSAAERVAMIFSVPAYKTDLLEKWLDTDGTKAGLLALLEMKREEIGK